MPLTPEQIEVFLSADRFGRYVAWSGSRADAVALYALNTAVSECLYTPIQVMEITLRNRMHCVLTAAYGEDWITGTAPFLTEYQKAQIEDAKQRIVGEKKTPTPPKMVASMHLGFWTSLLDNKLEDVWQQHLNAIARKPNGKGCTRKELKGPLERVRTLRNRIAHHEPILHLNLPDLHAEVQMLCGWLDPNAEAWLIECSRFSVVFPKNGLALLAPAPPAAAAPPVQESPAGG